MYGRDVYADSVWGSTVQCKRGSKLKLLTLPTLPTHPGVTFVNARGGSQLPCRVQVAAEDLRSSPPRPLIFCVGYPAKRRRCARRFSPSRSRAVCSSGIGLSKSTMCPPGRRTRHACRGAASRTHAQPVLVLLSRDRVVKAAACPLACLLDATIFQTAACADYH